MLPVVPQTTSYKPLPTFVEGSTPGILEKQQYLHVSVRNQGSSQLKSPSWTKMCHTEDEEHLAQLETEFLTTLSLSHAHQPESQFACCICSHCFPSGLFREEKVTLLTTLHLL